MQLPNWLKAILQPRLTEVTNRPTGANPMPVGVFPIYPEANFQNYINAYVNNSSVYTIVVLMARKFAYIPRYIFEVEDLTARKKYQNLLKSRSNIRAVKAEQMQRKAYGEQIYSGALSDLLNRPNEFQGQDAFYQMLYTYKKLTGNSFVWLNRGVLYDEVEGEARYDLPVLEMWVLPSQWVTIRIDNSYTFGEIIGYTFYRDGTPVYMAKEDILHWKDPNPLWGSLSFQQFYGISPLQPGMALLTQDSSARDAAVAMYQNGGAKGALVGGYLGNQMITLTPGQKASLDNAVDTKINNRAMKSAVVQLPGQWDYLNMAMNSVDMDLVEAQDKTFQRIANLLGCNPQLFETQTTFNNVEQARKDLITNAILPDCCAYRDEENRVLLRAFKLDDSKYQIDVDPSHLAELQDDIGKMTATIMSNWGLTPNQRLQELGYDESDNPEMDEVWVPNNIIKMSDAAMPTPDLGSYDPNTGTNTADSGGTLSNGGN